MCLVAAGANSLFLRCQNSSLEYPAADSDRPGGEGQHLYPAVRMAFWQVEKSRRRASLCLLPTLPAAFPIALKTMCVTGRDIPRKCLRALKQECGLRPRAHHRRHRIGHGNLDTHAAGEWQSRLRQSSRTRRCAKPASDCLPAFPKFTSVAGTAEATTLPDAASISSPPPRQRTGSIASVHAREFARILKPGGWLVLLWNERCHECDSVSARLRATAADLRHRL